MLRRLIGLLVVTWCLLGISARPARRHFNFYRTPQPHVAVHVNPVDLDQAAEASSLVDDFEPQQGNLLSEGRRVAPPPRFRDIYTLPEQLTPTTFNRGCPNCDSLDGVVTLGESRSYSVVTNPRQVKQTVEDTIPQAETSTQWLTHEPTTETSTTEESITTEIGILAFSGSSSVSSTGYQGAEPVSLQTEERPYATAVQRSQFSVEEVAHEPLASSAVERSTEKLKMVEVSSNVGESTEKAFLSTSLPLRYYPMPNARTDRSLFLGNTKYEQGAIRLENERPPGTTEQQGFLVVENSSPSVNPLSSPVSYHTALKSATSGSSVSFYREPLHFQRAVTQPTTQFNSPTERLKHETRVETVSYHEEVVLPQRIPEKAANQTVVVDKEKSYQFTNVQDQNFHHVQVTHLSSSDKQRALPYTSSQSYGQPEKVYGTPEQNYEVEEGLSVRSNGRAHGVQGTRSDNNKFGYVVEGRDFKKYRVEERTADGFIVGEYGVVRHDDGSLRGVRYTADSTINPRVIYEALVKFLSL